MGGQISFTVSLIMIGLFTIAILGYAINFAEDNDSVVSISDDSDIYSLYGDVEANVSGFSDDSESQYQSILETTIEPGSDTPQSAAPFAITPFKAIGSVDNILKVAYVKIFGSDSGFGIFLNTFIGIIIFIFGLYVYKTWRGLPD